MMNRMTTLALIALATLVFATAAQAEQYYAVTGKGPKVVHTRLAPVLVHRAFPPYAGQHVYGGRSRGRDSK